MLLENIEGIDISLFIILKKLNLDGGCRMEKIEIAALSQIADILSDSEKSPIVPEEDVWKKIFYNAELGEMFEERSPQFKVVESSYGWHPDEKDVYFNDKTYNGLIESFKELEYRRAELVKLLNNIASKMSLRRILESDIDEKIKIPRKYDYFEDYFEAQDRDGKNEIINEYSRSVFKKLRRNLNLISLDIHFEDNEFTIMSFTERTEVNDFDLNLITRWLAEKYPEVCKSYEAARKAYSSGDESGCVTHCRNILTGIFTYNKQEGREWYSGLQKACKKDKNILNVKNLKNIKQMKYDSHSADREHRYKYPRFRMISEVYAITCDLGAHINEGNVTETNDEIKVDLEEVTLEDALWILRMTEDILIWLYQTGNIND